MSRSGSSVAVFVAFLWAAIAAPAVAVADESGIESSFRHRMVQGRFLLDAGKKADALGQFEAAAEMSEGRRSVELHTLLARVRLDLGRIAEAVDAVRTARILADADAGPELVELHEFLTTRFGKVLVIGGGSPDAQLPEPIHAILDPELKRLFRVALDGFDDLDEGGSTSVYLPVGSYRVGSHIVTVASRETVRMDVRASVGSAGGGVYGERAEPESTGSTAAVAAPSGRVGALFRFGGLGFVQQGVGGGGASLLFGAEGALDVPGPALVLRAAVDVGLHPVERVEARDGTVPTFGVVPAGNFALGARVDLPGGAAWLIPGAAIVFGYGAPVAPTLPDGYGGPRHYLTYGGDLELRVRFSPPDGGAVHPELAARFLYRELLPLDALDDGRPHPSVGGGLGLSLWIAP